MYFSKIAFIYWLLGNARYRDHPRTSTKHGNVNSGLNINQESTHGAWSCLDLTFVTPVRDKETCRCQSFLKLRWIWHLPDLKMCVCVWGIIWKIVTTTEEIAYNVFLTRPLNGTVTWESIMCVCVWTLKWVPTGGWYQSRVPTTYQSSCTGITYR